MLRSSEETWKSFTGDEPQPAVVIFSMRPCSSEAWKGFFTYPLAPILRPRMVSSSLPSVEMMMTGMAW